MDHPKPVAESDTARDSVENWTGREVEAKDKAMILCWMWLAELAITERKDPEAKWLSMGSAANVASDISKKMLKLDIKAEFIEKYYEQSRKNAEHAQCPWDDAVAATIIRSRGPTSYPEIKKFLDQYEVRLPLPSASARGMIQMVDNQALGKWKLLNKTWAEFESGRLPCPPNIDAELEAAHNINLHPLLPLQRSNK